jgi:protein-disulfide isomerase
MDSGSLTLEPGDEPEGAWWRGAIDAPVTIFVFPDFTCPVCVEKERLVLQALDMYPESLRMVYHHYPSPGFGQTVAEALEAAGEQGKFWELHDRLLVDPPDDMSKLKACAAEIGLDMQKFDEALDSGRFKEKVERDKEEAISRGIKHVSVFINGNEYEHNPGTLADLCAAIDEELERIAKR